MKPPISSRRLKSVQLCMTFMLALLLIGCGLPKDAAPTAMVRVQNTQDNGPGFYELFKLDQPSLNLGPLKAPVCTAESLIRRNAKDCFERALTEPELVAQLERDQRLDGFLLVEDKDVFESPVFRLATYNVLGASHTEGGGANRPQWPDSPGRTRKSIELIKRSELTLLGLQEFQPPQYHIVRQALPNWGVYPGLEEESYAVQNSIIWDSTVWERLDARTIAIPYFGGTPFKMPYVLLKHIESGRQVWVGNFHNPADTRGNAAHLRARAVQLQANLAKELSTPTVPMIVTGDMNDIGEFFCPFTATAPFMHGSNGSFRDGEACNLTGRLNIDWITGSQHLIFTDHLVNNEPQSQMFSDHPLITATAQLKPLIFFEQCRVKKVKGKSYTFCPAQKVRRVTGS